MIRVFDVLWVGLAIAFAICFICVGLVHASPIDDRARGGASAGAYDLMGECLYYAQSADADTYLCRSDADEVTQTCGSVAIWVCNASGCDLAGELGSVTSLDATTELTIEAAIDTLGDISVGSIAQGDDKSICQGADTDWCCEWDTDGTEGLLCTAADCDGLGGSCIAAHVYEDGGNLIADLKGIDSITNSSQKITIGPPGTSSHSTGPGQCHFTCNGQEEHEGGAYFDSTVVFAGNMLSNGSGTTFLGTTQMNDDIGIISQNGSAGFYVYVTTSTVDASVISLPPNSNILYITAEGDHDVAWNMPQQTDPTPVLQSADETDQTQRSLWKWNRLALGGDGGGLGCLNQTFSYTDFTDDGGTSGHLDLDEQIPIGAVVQQMILHSLTGFTGDTTAVLTAGDDGGVDPDRYHSAGTLNVVASAAAGVDCGSPSGTTWHSAAVTVRLVLTGAADFGNFSAGEATISICYWTP